MTVMTEGTWIVVALGMMFIGASEVFLTGELLKERNGDDMVRNFGVQRFASVMGTLNLIADAIFVFSFGIDNLPGIFFAALVFFLVQVLGNIKTTVRYLRTHDHELDMEAIKTSSNAYMCLLFLCFATLDLMPFWPWHYLASQKYINGFPHYRIFALSFVSFLTYNFPMLCIQLASFGVVGSAHYVTCSVAVIFTVVNMMTTVYKTRDRFGFFADYMRLPDHPMELYLQQEHRRQSMKPDLEANHEPMFAPEVELLSVDPASIEESIEPVVEDREIFTVHKTPSQRNSFKSQSRGSLPSSRSTPDRALLENRASNELLDITSKRMSTHALNQSDSISEHDPVVPEVRPTSPASPASSSTAEPLMKLFPDEKPKMTKVDPNKRKKKKKVNTTSMTPWRAIYSEEREKHYYWNKNTGETTWDNPFSSDAPEVMTEAALDGAPNAPH